MYEDYELTQALESLDAAIEGASMDAWKSWKRVSENVKKNLRGAKSLMKRGKYKEAIPYIEDAKKDLEKAHSQINARTSWPLSSYISGFVGGILGIVVLFNEIDEEVLSGQRRLTIFGVQVINVLTSLASVVPGADVVANLGMLGVVISNKQFAKQKGLEEKGGFWNRVQRDMLFLINAYIKTCDELIEECETQSKYK